MQASGNFSHNSKNKKVPVITNNWIKPQWITVCVVLEHMTEAKGEVSEFQNRKNRLCNERSLVILVFPWVIVTFF